MSVVLTISFMIYTLGVNINIDGVLMVYVASRRFSIASFLDLCFLFLAL